MEEKKRELYVCAHTSTPKTVPIDPTSDDPFYRYKMRQLAVQVIGRGKMIKTAFVNGEDVAKDLKIPASYLPTYFAQQIGAKATYDAKRPERERASISGEFDIQQLSDVLVGFITAFIQCGSCTLPELSYVPLKKRVGVKCRSCGWKSYTDQMNLTLKFQKYVQNHPPPKTAHLDKNVAKGQKAVKDRQKADAKLVAAAGQLDVDVAEEEVKWETDVSAEAAAKRAAEMVPEKLRNLVDLTVAPAVAAEANDDDSVKVEDVRAALDDPAKLKELLAKAKDDDTRAQLLFNASFENLTFAKADYNKHKKVLSVFAKGDTKRGSAMIDAWNERLSADDNAALKKKVPVQAKLFYDDDIIDEEVFLAWSKTKNGKSAPFTKLAKPFLTWLEEADEESSEDEE